MAGPRYSSIPADAVLDRELSRLALHVLAALGTHADNNGWCVVKQKTLADKIGSSAGSVANAIGELVKRGYVRVRARHADNGAQLASLYQVVMDREPSDVVEDDGISSEGVPVYRQGGSSADEGGVHAQMKGGFIPTCTHKNDPSSERPFSPVGEARRRARPVSSKSKSRNGSTGHVLVDVLKEFAE
ncbi:MAG TPA: helix-turn-helix domain-containing protein [Rhizobiaceae bacterium]|nr:helix-turn-helix domain-containing protein [Rhizobiaceae bacterium]